MRRPPKLADAVAWVQVTPSLEDHTSLRAPPEAPRPPITHIFSVPLSVKTTLLCIFRGPKPADAVAWVQVTPSLEYHTSLSVTAAAGGTLERPPMTHILL